MPTIREFPEPVIMQYTEGATLPRIFGRLEIEPQDITGYTIVMKIEHPDDTVFDVTGAITDAATGNFVVPGANDFPAGAIVNGFLNAPIHFTSPSGEVTIASNLWLNVVRR